MIYLGDKPVGVANTPCGSFTKYARTTAVAVSANGVLEFTNPLGVKPQLVIVQRETLGANRITSVVLSSETATGGCRYGNSSGDPARTAYLVSDNYSGSNATAYLGVDEIKIAKVNSSIGFAAVDYTVDIYA